MPKNTRKTISIHHPVTKATSEVDPRSLTVWQGAGWVEGPLPDEPDPSAVDAVQADVPPDAQPDQAKGARRRRDGDPSTE